MQNKNQHTIPYILIILFCATFLYHNFAPFVLPEPASASQDPNMSRQIKLINIGREREDTVCLYGTLETHCADTQDNLIKLIQRDSPVKWQPITLSAYTSTPEQTDDTPCIGADGSNICELHAKGKRICASNDFSMHATIYIDGIGDCIIRDRMNKRYTGTNTVDLYMGNDTTKALQFGRQSSKAFIK